MAEFPFVSLKALAKEFETGVSYGSLCHVNKHKLNPLLALHRKG